MRSCFFRASVIGCQLIMGCICKPFLGFLCLTEVTLEPVDFHDALSWNLTTGWHAVCQCVHCAGDWRGGSPSQIAGCCPKSATHCRFAGGQKNKNKKIRDSEGQQSACFITYSFYKPDTVKGINADCLFSLWRVFFSHHVFFFFASSLHLSFSNICLDIIKRNKSRFRAVKPLALKHSEMLFINLWSGGLLPLMKSSIKLIKALPMQTPE